MLNHMPASGNETALPVQRQVKALLRLVEDLGYEVLTSPAGDWTVAARDDQGDRTIVGFDSASEVVSAARQLAESLQVDHKPAAARAPVG